MDTPAPPVSPGSAATEVARNNARYYLAQRAKFDFWMDAMNPIPRTIDLPSNTSFFLCVYGALRMFGSELVVSAEAPHTSHRVPLAMFAFSAAYTAVHSGLYTKSDRSARGYEAWKDVEGNMSSIIRTPRERSTQFRETLLRYPGQLDPEAVFLYTEDEKWGGK